MNEYNFLNKQKIIGETTLNLSYKKIIYIGWLIFRYDTSKLTFFIIVHKMLIMI